VVDDERIVRDLLSRWLRDEGYLCMTASSAAAAWTHLQQYAVDVVTLDITMPGGSGLDLLDQIRQSLPDIAVIMLTAEGDTAKAIRALSAGAHGYLIKPVERQELLIQVRNAVERQRLVIENREYMHELEHKVREHTRAIRMAYEETIHRLVKASLYRDEETGAHIKRTGWYSELLAATIGWDYERVEQIRLAAPMHDIGKIAIPDSILCKPGKLTPDEFTAMQKHAQIGATLLADSQSPVLRMAHEIALGHHERWDGSGYPSGLKGTEIPESARIVAIVDVYDALTHDRVYRPALPEQEILTILRSGRGTHFDPELLDAFMSLLPEMRVIAEAVTDFEEEGGAVQISATELKPGRPPTVP
jgi:putative two-component system response regulator